MVSLVVLFWHDVRLDHPVYPPADNLAILPAAAQRFPLVRLRAVQGERRAYVPQFHRAVVAAAQHLESIRQRVDGEERGGKRKDRDRAKQKDNHNAKDSEKDKNKEKDKDKDKNEQDSDNAKDKKKC